MDSGFYAACSGLAAKARQLEAAAHNLANLGTTAYKAQNVTFRSELVRASRMSSQLNVALNEFGVTGSPQLDLDPGTLESTGNDLDLAIEGPGFLAMQTSSGPMFTRNGHLRLSTAGELLSIDGSPVLGEAGPIQVPPGVAKLQVSADGTISANGALLAKLRLVEFADPTSLTESAPGNFISQVPPRAATSSSVRQGALEASNVNGVEAAVGLIAIQRHAEMLQRAMSIFHSEFNRIAAGELSRI